MYSQEVTVSLVAPKKISMDSAVAAVLSERDSVFKMKEELTDFGKSLVKHCRASLLATGWCHMFNVTPHTSRKL